MLSDEVLEKVTERIVERMSTLNTNILKHIGSKLDEIGTLNYTQAQKLVQTLKYGGDYNKIVNELAKISKLNTKEIKEIFEEVAKNDYMFAKQFYDYRGIGYIPFEENVALQNEVKAIANITARRCAEMMTPRALGFGMIDQKTGEVTFKGLKKAYYDLLDEAVLSVNEGKETFDTAMSRQIKQMGGGGLKVIYESTYINKDGVEVHNSRRLDSAIRMNLKDSLRELHNETQAIFGEEFKSDGVEISVHGNPAPDHELVQGRQFSNAEFNKFQNDEDCVSYDGIFFPAESEETGRDRRSISEYNCYHYTFSIVLGISKPEYSNEQLQEIIDKNNEGFEIDGKHYTMYEGTQMQRNLETEIRKQKDIQIMAKASGQDDLVMNSQQKITQLTQKYKELSKVSGLPTKMDRMKVSGYKRTKIDINNAKEITYARENNQIWHSTENLEEILKSNKIEKPSIAVGKQINGKVKYGSQFIEFKPEILENVNKSVSLYRGDGGNMYTSQKGQFNSLMQMLKDTPKIYNELKFNNDLDSLKYIKKVYVRQDEPKEILQLLKDNNIEYEIYKDYRARPPKKRK